MRKRIFSVVLILVMIVAMASCGDAASKKNTPPLSEKMESLIDLQAGKTVIVLDLDMNIPDASVQKLGLKLECNTSDTESSIQTLDVSYRLDTKSEYKDLTTIMIDHEYTYVNVEKLKSLNSDILTALQMDSLPEELTNISQKYLRIKNSKKDGGLASAGLLFSFFLPSFIGIDGESAASYKTILPPTVNAIEQAVKDIEPKVIEKDDSTYTIHFNKENGEKVLGELSKADFSESIDAYLKIMESTIKNLQEDYEDLSGGGFYLDNETLKQNIQEGISGALKMAIAAFAKIDTIDATYTLDMDGEKGSQKVDQALDVDYEKDDVKVKLTLRISIEEGVYEKIEAPTDYEDYKPTTNNITYGEDK